MRASLVATMVGLAWLGGPWTCPPVAQAGLAPLVQAGKKLHLAKRTVLVAERDTLRYRLLPDRIEAEQILRLHNPKGPAIFLLGLPLPQDGASGPQDVRVERIGPERPVALKTRRAAAFGWRPVDGWQAVRLRLGRDERCELRVVWWQPHAVGELHGYARLLLADPLWTSGAFAQPVAELERFVKLEAGLEYSASQPEADEVTDGLGRQSWEHRDRRWRRSATRPADKEILSLFYKVKRGALSRCADADPSLAVDGDPGTIWNPGVCPGDEVALELAAQCRGFGTQDPDCDHAPVGSFDLGVSVRTADGQARRPLELEGWWGGQRRWRVAGRQNQMIPIRRRGPLTSYRLRFPKGLGAGGAGEVSLLRIDPGGSDPNVEAVLLSKGWHKTTRRCRLEVGLVNPVALRHASLRFRPGTRMDTFLITADCADGRRRLTFHEPVPCNHTAAEIATAREALGDPDLEPMRHEHFRRKHPLQIELKLDRTCVMTMFTIMAPPVCTDSWLPVAPRVTVEY